MAKTWDKEKAAIDKMVSDYRTVTSGTKSGKELEAAQKNVNSFTDNAVAKMKEFTQKQSSSIKLDTGEDSAKKSEKEPEQKKKSAFDLQREARSAEKTLKIAQKHYDDYIQSEEYKNARQSYYQNQGKDGSTVPSSAAMGQNPQIFQDETEQKLRQERDQAESAKNYANQQAQAAEAEQVTNANLAEINAMPAEDRIALERYAVGTEVDRWESLNPAQNGFQIGRAQNQAADLIEKYGQEKVDQLAESWRWNYNAQQKQEIEKSAQEAAGKGTGSAILHSAGSVAANLAGSIAQPIDYLMQLGSRTGQYETLDPNSSGTIFDTYSSNVRGTVAQNIAGENNNPIRHALAYVYQGGMSAADNLARFALTGNPNLSLGLAAMGSFGQTMSEASANGATPEQAVLMAVANGGLEMLTEKIPLDELFKTWDGGKQTAKQIVMGAFKQAGLEATSEEINFLAQMVAEAIILREKSSYNQQIGELVANGMSYEDAKQQANNTVWKEAFDTAITSGISGGLSQVGAGLRANAREVGQLNIQQSETMGQTPAATPAASVQQPQETAQQVQTQPQETAQQVQEQPQAGQIQQDNTQGDSTVNLAEGIPTLEKEQRVKTEAEANMDQTLTDILSNGEQQQRENAGAISLEQNNQVADAAQADVQSSTQQEDISRKSAQEGQYQPGMQSQPSEDVNQSKTFTNTGLRNASEDVRQGYREVLQETPQAADYQVRHRADTLRTAQERVNSPERVNAEYDYLMGKDYWTADDVATSTLLQDRIMKSGDPDAAKKFAAISEKKKQIGSAMGQATDAFRIQEGTMQAANSPATAVDSFYNSLDAMQEKETTFKQKKNGPDFKQWKKQIKEDVTRIGIAIEMVDDGDAGAMRDVIRQIAQQRKTTAWFGTSDRLSWNANRILNKLGFEDLKTIANTQVAAMADDYRARTKSDIIAGIRKQNMLTSIKTFNRNISGNTFGGLADSVSDSLAGRMADYLISKVTGQRTVGNDLSQIQAYAKGAKEAGDFASLCVELGIPIETDAAGAYAAATGADGGGKYIGKTFRANGNVAMRAMYAYQKYMSYSLEVSDKIFEGGTNAAVTESLQRLNGLSEQQISDLSEFTANRRTFKNATWTDEDGTVHGAVLARRTRKIKDAFGLAGDIVLPFAEVPMNVAQTGIDYTAGVVKGIGEIASIIKDAKQGKTINTVRQRQAATDFGRGLTGVGMISLFAAAAIQGAIKVTDSDDWDEEALMQSEGRTGAQINWSALERGMKGESSEWKAGDVITSLDFLEPYNTQIYLGYELAQADDLQEALKQYPGATIQSVFNSLMDSPMMDGPEQILETIQEVAEAETLQDKINVGASYAGDVASSFIPQVVRQAAQYTDGYYRDTRGATPVESAINSLKAAIPGLSQTLPMKYNGLGEPQKRGDFSSIFLDPTNTMEYQPNEVTTYLENLREQLPDDVGFIPDRQAPMSISVNGIERALDGTQRETYQKTYGEKVNEYYSSLIQNQDFSQLTPELQAEALEKAEQYATSFAKSAVSEYKEVPKESTAELTKNIVRDTVLNSITNIFTDLNVAEEYGYDQKEHEQALDAAYQQFQALSAGAQADAREEATGNTSRYLEVRDNGVSQDAYLAASREVENVQGTGKVNKDTGKANVRDIDKREAVANTYGLTESQIDTIMRAYMPDYDPEAESKEYTEVKYDYIRQVLGLTPAEYAETYRAHLDNSKKADKIAAMMEMGFSRETATKLYKIYQGDATTKQQMLDWYGQ